MVTSKVFRIHQGTCLDIVHRIIVCRDHPFWSRDHRGHIDRIEWNKLIPLSLMTDRCQSNQLIQNSHLIPWFWLMPNRSYFHPSYQINFYWKLRLGCFATIISFECEALLVPKEGMSWKKLISLMTWTQNRSYGPHSYTSSFTMGPWTYLSFFLRWSSHSTSLKFHPDSSQGSYSSKISPRSIVHCAESLRVIRSSKDI
jgi:hypothetical protein